MNQSVPSRRNRNRRRPAARVGQRKFRERRRSPPVRPAPRSDTRAQCTVSSSRTVRYGRSQRGARAEADTHSDVLEFAQRTGESQAAGPLALSSLVVSWAATSAGSSSVPSGPAGRGSPRRDRRLRAAQRALVDKYCVTCHNARLKTGGLVLDKDADRRRARRPNARTSGKRSSASSTAA